MNVISRGVRNAFRNSIRTFSIVFILALSIGMALTMLIARNAVQAKINSVKGAIGNTITISPAGARGFEGGGEPLTTSETAKVQALPHVVSMTQTLQDRLDSTGTNLVSALNAGTLGRRNRAFGGDSAPSGAAGGAASGAQGVAGNSTGNFTPPIFVTGTSSLSATALPGGGKLNLTSGQEFDASKDAPVALVGKTLADKNSLKLGSTFKAYATTVTVAGIYDSGNNFSNNSIIMPLAAVQRLSDQSGQVSSALVQVDSITNLSSTTASIQSTLGSSVADVTSQQDTSQQALAPLENIKSISLYSLIGAVVAGAIIILLTMMMIVRERRREIGVMKAIGASNVKVVGQFMSEAVTFTLLSAVIGLLIGVAAGSPVTKVLVSSSANAAQTAGQGGGGFGRGVGRLAGLGAQNIRNVQTSIGWDILLYGLLAALIIAVLGSAIPAFAIAKIRPAEVMRAE